MGWEDKHNLFISACTAPSQFPMCFFLPLSWETFPAVRWPPLFSAVGDCVLYWARMSGIESVMLPTATIVINYIPHLLQSFNNCALFTVVLVSLGYG